MRIVYVTPWYWPVDIRWLAVPGQLTYIELIRSHGWAPDWWKERRNANV